MKLALAAGLLSQSLPALSEKSHDDLAGSNLDIDVAGIIGAAKKAANSNPALQYRNNKNRVLADSRRLNLKEAALKNALSKFTRPVLCNPESSDADVGILSCGQDRFCKPSATSDLGGICVRKNLAHSFSGMGALKNTKTKRSRVVECDPTSVDVGILACEEGQFCKEDDSSTLGGLCVSTEATSRHLQTVNLCNPASSSFSNACNCSGLDNSTGTGTVDCVTATDYNVGLLFTGCDNATLNETSIYGFQNSLETYYENCYTFITPYYQKTCVKVTGNTCNITLDGQACASCILQGKYYQFDCSNIGGPVGNDSVALFPIIKTCYTPSNHTNVTFNCTSLCAPGDSIPYAMYDINVTVANYGSYSCGNLAVAEYLGDIPQYACAAFSAAAQSGCCEYQCDLCGANSGIPTANLSNPVNIPISGYQGYTCGDFAYAAYVNFSLPPGTCAPIAKLMKHTCCGPLPKSCNLCGGPLVDPMAMVSIGGYTVQCSSLETFLNSTQCNTVAPLVGHVCCGTAPASAPSSVLGGMPGGSPAAMPSGMPGSPSANTPNGSMAGASALLSAKGIASIASICAATAAFIFST